MTSVSAKPPNESNQVDWRSVKVLLYSFLVMDFRNQAFGQVTRSSAKDMFSPMYWVTGQNLLISFFVAGVLFARVEIFAFAFICLTLSMIVCVTSIIVEFNEIVLSPDDLHVIGHQPVSYKTYAAARLLNLILYICFLALTLCVVPAVFGVGFRETSYVFAILFPVAAFVGSFLAAGCIILFYVTVFGGRPSSKVQETLAWTQAALMLITGYGGQAVLRDSQDQLEMAIYHMPAWFHWTPPGLLGQFAISGDEGWIHVKWWILLAAIGITIVVWLLVFRYLARAYSQFQDRQSRTGNDLLPALARPGDLFSGGLTYRFVNWFVSDSTDEKVGYWLTKTMLSRDHNFRMRIWPTFGITIAFVGIGMFTGELVDPLTARGQSVALTITAIYSLVLPLPTIFYSMRFSKFHQASWILSVAPIKDSAAFARGIEKAIILWVMLPFMLLMTLVLCGLWSDPVSIVLHLLAALILIFFSAYVSSGLIFRQIPFSQPLGRGEMVGPIAPLMALIGTIAMSLGTLHYLATIQLSWFAGYVVLLFALTLAARAYTKRIIRRRCNLEWYHEAN